ncbi:NLR family CARD domain-containing protein 3-like [Seriola lalandi dorsalis]|uniref:NLR family CARD domain-containing protein 3-like n=2 Tax=Seriola lalandi dorsalis TaxID=1841481 RepID=UPI000C6F96A3|nr:NLR family CARD domain-containing protein 3-like [Seriola lalandi dorsalis]XP_023261624.1 NLR family CARD domain-containing protein 3-like [Seriola lalandi dorsalis]XP_056237651.1 NLR family CARD domain-containing protein 3-like [Seriola aureovittata]
MASAQQLLRSQRDLLLNWTCDHPAPLLRWLHDAEVLSSPQYLSLLERSPVNAVAQALETVCAMEESSQKFLLVLREVQDYYCGDLQVWVERHCRRDAVSKPVAEPVKVEDKKPKGPFAKLLKGKSKRFTPTPEVKAKEELKPGRSVKLANIRVPISAHKTTLLKRTEQLKCYSEGEGMASNSASHIEIRYTDLFVTEDNDLVDSSQHEYFDLASRRARIYVHQACQRIRPCHLLSPEATSGRSPKRVKVKGIAGIGKSIAVQRLVYEWAIGKSMREFTCVFDLRFRELNLIEAPLSLMELLGERFRYLKAVLPDLFASPSSLLFILDGLDEFKFPLDWNSPGKNIDVNTKVPVSELMVALIKGSFLPEASVILTTRPSTEAPKHFFQKCCVVLGFEEDQVKEYTSKFYKDSKVAEKVYDYISNNDNLFVLSFIPLYCYIICTAMAEFFSSGTHDVGDSKSLELNPPRTVSEVYFCYLFTAVKHHALRGSAERSTPRSEVLSLAKQQLTNLGKLAYENLLQKKIMFTTADLENYGVTPADVQSTFLCHILQPLKEETVEMFSFFHLTVQEHLAALYCSINLFSEEDIIQALDFWCFGVHPPSSIAAPLQNTDLNMDKLESLQMFTRFFMGLLRARLAGQLDGLVLSPMEHGDGIPTRLGVWFQDQFKGRKLENQTALNLLHCLTEFHMKEATSIAAPEIKTLNLFKMKLSVVDCAAMHYVLQFSPHKLQELNLGYSNIGNRGLNRLGPILHRCESLYLRYNCLDRQAAILESAILRSNECQVKKLFMCGNNLGPEGVLELWNALEHNTTVEELYLDITGITERGTENIVNCLSKNTSLKTLTIVGNDIGDKGRRRLKELGQSRPGLRIIANFVDDLGLLQAYLDWVEEIRVDRDQMDSVKNADALQSVLKGLKLAGEQVEKGENAEKAKELHTKIVELLKTSTDMTGQR